MCCISRDQAFQTFNSFVMNLDKLGYMQYLFENNFDFSLECQPDAWLQRFCQCKCSGPKPENKMDKLCTNDGVNPIHVAQVFTKCFGEVILCEEATRCMGKPCNIIDCLKDIGGDVHMSRQLFNAFKALGHRRA